MKLQVCWSGQGSYRDPQLAGVLHDRVATEWQAGGSVSQREPNGGGISYFRSASGGLTSTACASWKLPSKPSSVGRGERAPAACTPLTMQPVPPGMPAWALRTVMSLCLSPAAKHQAPPGQLGTDANQKLRAQSSCHPPLSWQPAVHGGRACGLQSRVALERISCSLKGGQRGVWGSEGQGETAALGATRPACWPPPAPCPVP